MRICDVCKGDTVETWQVAMVRVSVERLDPEFNMTPQFQAWDTCEECLEVMALPLTKKPRDEESKP